MIKKTTNDISKMWKKRKQFKGEVIMLIFIHFFLAGENDDTESIRNVYHINKT